MMQGNLSIESITVQHIYSRYIEERYIINRRYQRKLVWSIEEKAKFIDSLLQGFPIPMIIAANANKKDGKSTLEVLDGMQRLNAIVSFIEGEFPIDGEYFDLTSIATTKQLLDNNQLKQKTPLLKLDSCSRILEYPVPFSVCDGNDTNKVDESFRRINTGGRTLSKQDVRQAGALGTIPDLIRDCAVYVRTDSSRSNIINLKNMKNISLSNKGLEYGINLTKVFWAKHGIITYENIRKSRDEELIAHIIAYIADPQSAETTARYLDNIYDPTTAAHTKLNLAINKVGASLLHDKFCFVFDELKKTIESSNKLFGKLIYRNTRNKVGNAYQVIFLAFYKALINKNLQIVNYLNLCNSLSGIHDKHLRTLEADWKWNKADREALINSTYGLIEQHFKERKGSERGLSNWVQSLENILNQSKTEQVSYDFKLGLHKISDNSGEFIPETFNKIIKTLTAMTNTIPGDCFVILGVADNEASAKQHQKHYDSEYLKYNGFCVVGIDSEANKYCNSLEQYQRKLLTLIDKQPISDNFKLQIKSNIIPFTYNKREIIMFKVNRLAQPEPYKGKFYTRTLSFNEEVDAIDQFKFFKQFEEDTKAYIKNTHN